MSLCDLQGPCSVPDWRVGFPRGDAVHGSPRLCAHGRNRGMYDFNSIPVHRCLRKVSLSFALTVISSAVILVGVVRFCFLVDLIVHNSGFHISEVLLLHSELNSS